MYICRFNMEGYDMWRGVILVFVFMTLLNSGKAFNIDLRTRTLFAGPHGGMFGFTMAQHKEDGDHWLLVGAPTAPTNQTGVERGGAVYKCPVGRDGRCHVVDFDTSGNHEDGGRQKENKTNQWFGASVVSGGQDRLILACAPRYIYFTKKYTKREPIGNCYYGRLKDNRFSPFSPCKRTVDLSASKKTDQYQDQGFCQISFSTAITDKAQFVVGGVGSWSWQGQLIINDPRNPADFTQTTYNKSEDHYTSLMGYSLAAGDFDGNTKKDYAVGRPRWKSFGKVELLDGDTVYMGNRASNLVGRQAGEYFGHSVIVDDFNNDTFDDIAVGAPFYCHPSSDTYENGRVYVFYQATSRSFEEIKETILPGNPKYSGRFGRALGKIGDVNKDGINDLAVGAPYDGPDGKGAVYIYHGSQSGIITKPSQIIHAAEVNEGLSTFGYSIAGGHDIDNNRYPDIAVGASESNHAIQFKSRPVIKVKVKQFVNPLEIDLRATDCELSNGMAVPCMNIETRVSYEGVGTPESIELVLKWELDTATGIVKKRALFRDNGASSETRQLRLRKHSTQIMTLYSYIQKDVRDKLTPIVVRVTFDLRDPVGVPQNTLLPVLDEYTPRELSTEANILKNCGNDSICVPDLKVNATGAPSYNVFGKKEHVYVSMVIENLREDAFEAQAFIVIPEGVSYSSVKNESAVRPINCHPTTRGEHDYILIICDLGNPMKAGEKIMFTLDLDTNQLNVNFTSLDFDISVNSTNQEESQSLINNHQLVQIPLTVQTSFELSGVSKPETVLYNYTFNDTIRTEEDAGPQVIHLYEVVTYGPSDIKELDVQITWPVYLGTREEHLLYLTEAPKVIKGQGTCNSSNVDPLNITARVNPIIKAVSGSNNVSNLEGLSIDPSELKRQKRNTEKGTSKILDCERGVAHCIEIRCTLYNLIPHNQSRDHALIQVKSRLWAKTLLQAKFSSATITSEAVAKVTKTPYMVLPDNYPSTALKVNTSTVSLKPYKGKEPIKVWVIAVSIAGGFIVLLLLVVLLWKCGFFKRQRVETHKGTLTKSRDENGSNGKLEK